jgi:membrane-associated PAP2 superfamily phosphatase
LFLAATLALGPGLLVNGIFKPNWGRPRPHQTVEFGGKQAFVAVWGMGTSRYSKSFPSGHASMGFYLMAPAFLLYRRRRAWAFAFLLLGLAAGLALGIARIAQGAHFPSDVLWSAGMVYLSGLLLLPLFRLGRSADARRLPRDVAVHGPAIVDFHDEIETREAADEAAKPAKDTRRQKAA